MNPSDNDPFKYRSQGGAFSVGSEEGDNMSALVKVDNQLLCITRKNIRMVLMADSVDPQRTNPNIDHNVQHILPYGSDNEFVGRTFQQASILFEEHSLRSNIDYNKGISISFSFLKEITALDKLKNEYTTEEKSINSDLSSQGKNPPIPALPNLEQKLKGFISNADHATGRIMELALLFYPTIKPADKHQTWEEQLYKIIKSELGEDTPFATFIFEFKEFTEKMRTIRNKIEHPYGKLKDDILLIENYKLTPANVLDVPSISFKGKEYNLPKMSIVAFMELTTANLLTIFELLMAYLCNQHAKPFAGEKRVVISVPEKERKESEKHVRFKYDIFWTK